MKANEPEKFKECVSDAINEVYYRSENELWYKGYYKRAVENAEKMVCVCMIHAGLEIEVREFFKYSHQTFRDISLFYF